MNLLRRRLAGDELFVGRGPVQCRDVMMRNTDFHIGRFGVQVFLPARSSVRPLRYGLAEPCTSHTISASKAFLAAVYERWARVHLEHEVPSQKQAIDILVEANPLADEDIEFPLFYRMSASGVCMFESFYNTPGLADIEACIRKQLVYHQHLILRAKRASRSGSRKPRLWILSSGSPRRALDAYEARPMAGWPAGFWQTREVDAMSFVVLGELPASRESLLLRLLGRGPTLRGAIEELHALPPESLEHRVAMPVLLAFQRYMPQNFLEEEDMNILQELRANHAAWERQVRREGRKEGERAMLIRQLTRRFGPLPEAALERIENAGADEVEAWGDLVLTADTLDDVLV